MVLCSRAARLASENKEVLIVTYNITLLNYLLDLAVRYDMNGKVRNQITALHFHGLCKRLAYDGDCEDEHNAIFNQGIDDKSSEVLGKKALSWASEIDEEDKYDAVFIDEGQDFYKEWLDVLGKLVKKDGELVLCVDQAQNIYGNSPIPEKTMSLKGFGTSWVSLDNSYRMPLSVCKLATSFLEEFLPNAENLRPIPKQDEMEFNTNLDWVQCDRSDVTNKTVGALLNIIKKSKSTKAFADLTCIVGSISNGIEIAKALKDKNIKCIDTFEEGRKSSKAKKLSFYKGSATVKLTTISSFKGWESTAVVMQCTRAESVKDMALFYSAITRIRKSDDCYVSVVNTDKRLRSFGKKWTSQVH
jgi:superfamily I DNA/RNA helicase